MSVKHAASVIDSANKCVDVWMCRHSTRKKSSSAHPAHTSFVGYKCLVWFSSADKAIACVVFTWSALWNVTFSNQRENTSSDLNHRFLPNFCDYYHQSTLCLNCLAIVNALGRCHCYLLSISLWVCVCVPASIDHYAIKPERVYDIFAFILSWTQLDWSEIEQELWTKIGKMYEWPLWVMC